LAETGFLPYETQPRAFIKRQKVTFFLGVIVLFRGRIFDRSVVVIWWVSWLCHQSWRLITLLLS